MAPTSGTHDEAAAERARDKRQSDRLRLRAAAVQVVVLRDGRAAGARPGRRGRRRPVRCGRRADGRATSPPTTDDVRGHPRPTARRPTAGSARRRAVPAGRRRARGRQPRSTTRRPTTDLDEDATLHRHPRDDLRRHRPRARRGERAAARSRHLVALAEEGYYTACRSTGSSTGFVIQAGDPAGTGCGQEDCSPQGFDPDAPTFPGYAIDGRARRPPRLRPSGAPRGGRLPARHASRWPDHAAGHDRLAVLHRAGRPDGCRRRRPTPSSARVTEGMDVVDRIAARPRSRATGPSTPVGSSPSSPSRPPDRPERPGAAVRLAAPRQRSAPRSTRHRRGGPVAKQWSSPPELTIDPSKTTPRRSRPTAATITAKLYRRRGAEHGQQLRVPRPRGLLRRGDLPPRHQGLHASRAVTRPAPAPAARATSSPTSSITPASHGYKMGTLAMANAGPNTNGSQFFICHQDVGLPPSYNVFGKAIDGLDVVDDIAHHPDRRAATGRARRSSSRPSTITEA